MLTPQDPNYVGLKDTYSKVLDYLAVKFKPETFLTFLPEKGKLSFFLPFIEKCLFHHKAQLLNQTLAECIVEYEKEREEM